MTPIFASDLLILLGLAIPLIPILRLKPLRAGDPLAERDAKSIQSTYESVARIRMAMRAFCVAMAGMCLYGYFSEGGQKVGVDRTFFLEFACAFSVGNLLALAFNSYLLEDLNRRHPELHLKQIPLWVQLVSVGLVAGGLVTIGFGITRNDIWTILGALIVGEILLIARGRLILPLWRKYQIFLAPDDPFRMAAVRISERLELPFSTLVVLPSLVPNAWVLRDGRAYVSSILLKALSVPEFEAVLIHEYSHVRDRDVKRLTRRRLFGLFVVLGITLSTVIYPLYKGWGNDAWAIPAAMWLLTAQLPIFSWFFARLSQKLEFKCDALAAELGMASEMASGLRRISNLLGAPLHWAAYDRPFLTHPDLSDRLARLEGDKS